MRNINYKYNIGDTIAFKPSFSESACTTLFGLEGKVFEITDRKDYGGPTYKLFGLEGYFAEDCFAGLAVGSVDTPEGSFAVQVDMEQGDETECDTDDSEDPEDCEADDLPLEEAKWYRISFSAKLTPDDLRAMKKCFFDAMNEAMEIYDLADLEIEEED